MRVNAATDLPDPLSPTMPMVSPGRRVKETDSSAFTTPERVRNSTVRFSTDSKVGRVRGSGMGWDGMGWGWGMVWGRGVGGRGSRGARGLGGRGERGLGGRGERELGGRGEREVGRLGRMRSRICS